MPGPDLVSEPPGVSRRPLPLRAPSTRPTTLPQAADVVVVGAGIVGLAAALEALSRGSDVVVVERHARALGASVRNLGHIAVTAQDGPALGYALATRDKWIALSRQAGFRAPETGTVVVARADDEMAVLEDIAAARDGAVQLLDGAGVAERVPSAEGAVGGAFLRLDLRVDPRAALTDVAAWFARQPRASLVPGTAVLGVEPGNGRTLVHTSRGDVVARRVVLAVGADVDGLFPGVAEEHGLGRSAHQVLRVAAPGAPSGADEPALLSGTSLLHYGGFTRSPQHKLVRERLEHEQPALLAAGVDARAMQRADGTWLLGDTQRADVVEHPFRDEAFDELLLRQGELLLGGPLRVLERWTGVQPTGPGQFLVAQPQRGLLVVSVTSGTGMTTAFGLLQRSLDGFL